MSIFLSIVVGNATLKSSGALNGKVHLSAARSWKYFKIIKKKNKCMTLSIKRIFLQLNTENKS